MKPIRLTMTAFGPYKGTEEIDFRQLEDHRLFVVSGATGAGKTTIFDGICFALYGQASGEDRTDIRSLRSDFADDAIQTAVELVFTIHRRTYRIMRQIPYIKKGNKSETSAKCELFELTAEGETPIVDRQIVSEINRKVEELLGLTQIQFSQIVMLPQGEFRKFLTSDTENKEAILRKIFKTDDYRGIVEVLKKRKDTATLQLTNEKAKADHFIQQITAIVPTRESLLFEVLRNEYMLTSQVLAGLDEEILYYTEKAVEDEKLYTEAHNKHGALLETYHSAKNTNEQFTLLEQRKMTLETLEQQKPHIQLKEKQLADADRAAIIHEIESYYIQQEQEVLAKRQELEKTTEQVDFAMAQLAEIERVYSEVELQEPERDEASEKLIRLRHHLPAVTQLAAKQAHVHQLLGHVRELHSDHHYIAKKTAAYQEKQTLLKKQIADVEEAIVPFDMLVEQLNKYVTDVKIVEKHEQLQAELASCTQKAMNASSAFRKAKEEFEGLQNNWLSNQAAHLAHALQEGQPCPVCGSVDHPEKHAQREGEAVSREQLENKRAHLTEVERSLRVAEARLETIKEQSTALEQEMAEEKITDSAEVVKRKQEEIAKKVQVLKEKKSACTLMKVQLSSLEKEVADWTTKLHAIEKQLAERKLEYERESALLQREITSIPEEVRSLPALEAEIQKAAMHKEKLEASWIAIQKKKEEAKEKLATSKNAQQYVERAVHEYVQKKQQAEARYKDALRQSDFNSEEAYRNAKLTEAEKRMYKEEVKRFNENLHATKTAIVELETSLKGKEKIDTSILAEQVDRLKDAYEQALTEWKGSIEYGKALNQLRSNLHNASEGIEELERKVSKLTSLHDVIRGQNHLKLSFERFIQIDYLERIIQSANSRLHNLSNGQFELMRSERQEIRGKQSGLGLDVYDAYTGQNRDVKTMSGGEKFNASLSLALGMADVIQSFQGGVSIETMFIDEGFGTLDEESLHKAVDTLIDLQKSGRMIGVISHVEELKKALPAILEVRKSNEGHSETKFILK